METMSCQAYFPWSEAMRNLFTSHFENLFSVLLSLFPYIISVNQMLTVNIIWDTASRQPKLKI